MPRKSPEVRPEALLKTIRSELSKVGSPARAVGQQAYMKSTMPYHGVGSPEMRAICKRLFAGLEFEGFEGWADAVRAVWDGAKFREERYAAIMLSGLGDKTPRAMPIFEKLIVEGAWWDYVDDVAVHRVGPLVAEHPKTMKPLMRRWSKDDDMWKRRTSIICQVLTKGKTDLPLLYACIEPSLASREFFLRKAIGWALRAYAWVDASEIKRYVRANESRLSGLSKREALKNV